MSLVKERATRSFINTAALEADEAVFDDVQKTASVLATDFVQEFEEFDSAHLLAVDSNRIALFEGDRHVISLVRSLFISCGVLEEFVLVFLFREFQDATFVREVPEVAVFGVDLLLADAVERNLVCSGVVDSVFAAMEVPLRILPRSDDFELRVECCVGEFETDLVVTLTGSTVSNSVSAFLFGDLYLVLGDERASERRTEEIRTFVLSTGANGRPNVFFKEFLLEVENVALGSTGLESLFFESLCVREVILAEVGCECNHFDVVGFLEPRNDDGGVKSTAIGEDDFLLGFCFSHFECPLR